MIGSHTIKTWSRQQKTIALSSATSGVRSTDERSPCPFCNHMLPVMELDCPSCKNTIPYCIITGRHMTSNDWCMCPNSDLPALYSFYLKYVDKFETDPMTNKPVSAADLVHIRDPTRLLKKTSS